MHEDGREREEFDALGPEAREFHLKLMEMPVKTAVHLRRLLALVRLYGRDDVLAAIRQALAYQTYDAAYVETLVHQERRRRELPSPTRFIQKLLGHKNLQTTTIYTRVAVLREQRVQSPIDTLTGKQSESNYVPQPEPSRPVGRMNIDLRPRKGEKAAGVKLTILNEDCSVQLDGIMVRETRPGWITMELPPLEHWESSLEPLPSQQRARIETPAFYALLQNHVSRRFLAQKVGA